MTKIGTYFLSGILLAGTAGAVDPRVVMVSVDGLMPADVAAMPRLLSLARRGTMATMKPVFPTQTWPNHTTLISGLLPKNHGIIGNRVFLREASVIQPNSTGPGLDAMQIPNLLSRVRDLGRGAGAIMWPLTHGMTGLACNIPEVYTVDDVPKGVVPAGDMTEFVGLLGEESGLLDRFATDRALDCMKSQKVSLMAVHYIAIDTWRHRGRRDGLRASLARAGVDAEIGRLIDTLGPSTRFVVVSDHGFSTVEETTDLNRVLNEAGLLDKRMVGKGGSGSGSGTSARNRTPLKVPKNSFRALAIQGTGYAYVYLATPEEAPATIAALQTVDCVESVIDNTPGIVNLGLRPARTRPRQVLTISDAPDLVVLPRRGCAFAVQGALHSRGRESVHGGVPTDPDLGAVFVAAGPGIGVGSGSLRSQDVAPTVAHMLGITLGYPIDGVEVPGLVR